MVAVAALRNDERERVVGEPGPSLQVHPVAGCAMNDQKLGLHVLGQGTVVLAPGEHCAGGVRLDGFASVDQRRHRQRQTAVDVGLERGPVVRIGVGGKQHRKVGKISVRIVVRRVVDDLTRGGERAGLVLARAAHADAHAIGKHHDRAFLDGQVGLGDLDVGRHVVRAVLGAPRFVRVDGLVVLRSLARGVSAAPAVEHGVRVGSAGAGVRARAASAPRGAPTAVGGLGLRLAGGEKGACTEHRKEIGAHASKVEDDPSSQPVPKCLHGARRLRVLQQGRLPGWSVNP